MAAGVLFAAPYFTALDDDGNIMPGAQLFFFLAGTTAITNTYADGDLLVPQTHPVIADSAGRAVVYFDPAAGDMKFILEDALSVQIGPTVDPIPVVDPTGGPGGVGAELFSFGSNSSAVVANTAYASGATFDKLHPGTSVWRVNPASLFGTYALEVTGVQDTGGTLSVSLMNLTLGAPDTPIATATVTSLTGEVAQSGPITFGSAAPQEFGIKTLVSANSGFLIGARIVRTA